MKATGILVIATIAVAAADVSHLLAASFAAQSHASSPKYIPPIPNALRSPSSGPKFDFDGGIGAAAQTPQRSVLPPPAPTPDSATQGPNPQDIATPEPEYIDIELPFPEPPPRSPAPAPAPSAPRSPPLPPPRQLPPAPAPAPVFSPVPNFGRPNQNYVPPSNEPIPGHSLEADGYHYRTPQRRYF